MKTQGYLKSSLSKKNSEVKQERSQKLIESLKTKYNVKLQTLKSKKENLEYNLSTLWDLNPQVNTALTFEVPDPEKLITSDLNLAIEIRQLSIMIEEAESRIKFLFGDEEV